MEIWRWSVVLKNVRLKAVDLDGHEPSLETHPDKKLVFHIASYEPYRYTPFIVARGCQPIMVIALYTGNLDELLREERLAETLTIRYDDSKRCVKCSVTIEIVD